MNIIYCFIIQKTSSHLFQLMSLAKQVKLGPIPSFLHLSQWSQLKLRKQRDLPKGHSWNGEARNHTPTQCSFYHTILQRKKRARRKGSPPRSPPDSKGLWRWAYPWPIDLRKLRKWASNWSQAAVASGKVTPRNGFSVAHNRRH